MIIKVVMKPCYTIEELAQILRKPFYDVAHELLACEVALYCDGLKVEPPLWKDFGAKPSGNGIFDLRKTVSILANTNYPTPAPSAVLVNSEAFTQTWKDYIIKAECDANACGESKGNELAQTERNSMVKLIAGMAIDGYGYDIAAKKNDAVANICSGLEKLGLKLSDDTIRRYIKLGIEQLPAKPVNT